MNPREPKSGGSGFTTVPTSVMPVDAVDSAAITERLGGKRVPVPASLLETIAESGAEVLTEPGSRADAARDWWPMAIAWAARGQVPALPAAVVRPSTVDQVSAVLAACNAAKVPVTPVAGRSGVCGGSVPVFGGVSLDMTAMSGVTNIDETSLLVDVASGTFGPDLEATLATTGSGYSVGHWPQSMALATVGGWIACRGAGQYSTRYGKIEDMVIGLEVVLADGTIVHTEGAGPRAATGPSLTQLFVGSEGTLGVVTSVRLRMHPQPPAEGRRAFGFPSFDDGLDACRRILRRGATPAVLRLYDDVESDRNFEIGDRCVLIVLDEGDPELLAATLGIIDQECLQGSGVPGGRAALALDVSLVEHWMAHRNDVSALAPLWRAGVVVDTVEIAARWEVLPRLAEEVVAALQATAGTLVASVHESHAYADGACLYFTFAGRQPEPAGGGSGGGGGGGGTAAAARPATDRPAGAASTDHSGNGSANSHGRVDKNGRAGDDGAADDLEWSEGYYKRAWDAVTETVEKHGGAISHHHGIGLNRSRFLPGALGSSFDVLASVKKALDPKGILNPGKLGLPTPFGSAPWP